MKLRLFFSIIFLSFASLLAVPQITTLLPAFGPESGGNLITITGSGFTGATAVTFGTTPATSFIVNSDTSISATVPAHVFGNVYVQVTTPQGSSASSPSSLYTYQGSWKAYVGYVGQVINGSIIVITVPSNVIIANIAGVGVIPIGIAFIPDGTFAYVANQGDNTATAVTPIRVIDNTALPPIVIGSTPPVNFLAITPDGTKAYVSGRSADEVVVIDTTNNSIITSIPTDPGTNPVGVVVTPDGSTVFVTLSNTDEVITIDVATDQIIGTPIPVGDEPNYIAITPNGTRLYVGNRGTNTISVIDIASRAVIANIPTGGIGLSGIAITPNSEKGYVINQLSNSLTPLNLLDNTAGTAISLAGVGGQEPFLIAITPDGSTAYITDFGGHSLIIFDVATDTPLTSFPLGTSAPLNIGITPDQAPVASFTSAAGSSGGPTLFNASTSRSPVGTIATYAWDFGDGQTVITSSPLISHTYSSSGNYTVRLTVTNSAGTSTEQVYQGQLFFRNGSDVATLTQSLLITAAAPSTFIGRLRNNVFLNRTERVLVLEWPASSSPDTLYYRIYRNGTIIFQGNLLTFNTCFISPNDVYELSVVSRENIESARVSVTIVE